MSETTERPEVVEDEHLKYLDDLRDSGKINMMGARNHLANEFVLGRTDSRTVHTYWIKTFGNPER
jgi:uncharacterized protein YciI